MLYELRKPRLTDTMAGAVSVDRSSDQASASRRPALNLRVGEWVEVRSAEEIAATLDEYGTLDKLPFMPEMLQYCGKRFRVEKSAHKTCDAISAIRRMEGAVHLVGLRCDGSGHDGCQAGCLLFFKDAWLKRVDNADAAPPADQPQAVEAVRQRLAPATRVAGTDLYRCQATELKRATTEVRRRGRWNPGLYIKDLTSGNVGLFDFIRYGLLAMINAFMYRWFGRGYPHVCGRAGKETPTASLKLQAGELVQVRSKKEIEDTLNWDRRNRGLLFDVEQVAFCESTFQVLRRVDHIIDEHTAKMVRLPNPNIILDGVACSGNFATGRMFCPRAIYPFWREIWLRRKTE